MLYISIIISVLCISVAAVLIVYFRTIHNPQLFKDDDKLRLINNLANNLLEKYELYENASPEDKFDFRVENKDVEDCLYYIKNLTSIDDDCN